MWENLEQLSRIETFQMARSSPFVPAGEREKRARSGQQGLAEQALSSTLAIRRRDRVRKSRRAGVLAEVLRRDLRAGM